jgi:hypothetical protein
MQETSHWPTHHWNVIGEQRKSNRQHPKTYYWEWEETPGNDECATSQNPHPYCTLPKKALQILGHPGRDVILEAIHFLLEIRNPGHSRLSGMHLIRSYPVTQINAWEEKEAGWQLEVLAALRKHFPKAVSTSEKSSFRQSLINWSKASHTIKSYIMCRSIIIDDDDNGAECVVCGQIMATWSSTNVPTFKLVHRPDDAA